jgi:alpha-glucosidase
MPKELIIAKSKVEAFDRYDDIYEIISPASLKTMETVTPQHFIFHAQNSCKLSLSFLTENIVRVRYTHSGFFEKDFSYAIAPDFERQSVDIQVINKDNFYLLQSKNVHVQVDKTNLNVCFMDVKGNVIAAYTSPFEAYTTLMKGTQKVSVQFQMQANEAYYGLGDKSWNLDLRGNSFEHWCTDAFGFGKNSDPLYRAIPFYIAQNEQYTYSIFLDNTYRSHFDFGKKNPNVLAISADGGEINYYFTYGKNAIEVAEQYVHLTGKASLPPIWALGYHQCRWSYFPDTRVKEVAADFRAKKIPCDAIYLDIDYMDVYRCFTVNKTYFPDLQGLVSDLRDNDFETVVMIDPGIFVDENYHIYQQGLEKDAFCRRFSGELMVGPVWPTACVFPDFTNPEVRNWWGDLYHDFYENVGISGFWNDMNEPAVFNVKRMTFPDEVQHDYDGQKADHKRAHNIYGMQMSRATQEGLQKIKPEKRPFLLTRATYSGGQRFAAVWTGDNFATWEHLRLANIQAQRLSLSGFSFCGSDIGGFAEMPDGELMVRWLQLAVFHPLMRVHSMGNHADGAAMVDENLVKMADAINRRDQEPWSFGDAFTPHAKAAIELRYQLLPYLYTAFQSYAERGTPIIKSAALLSFNFKNTEREFLFGEQIWVSPIEKKGVKKQTVLLPEGEWFYFYNHKKYSQKAGLKVDISTIPFFVKAGTVLPIAPVRQSTKEKMTTMELYVYCSKNMEKTISYLYEDAGEGFGESQKRTFTLSFENGKYTLFQARKGNYKVDYQFFKIKIIEDNKESTIEIEENFEWIAL